MQAWSRLRPVAVAALICALLTILSVLYVDRPVADYVAIHFLHRGHWELFFDGLASPSLLSLPFAGFYLAAYALRRISGRPDSGYTSLFLTISIAIAVATVAKDELKWMIGRPWPYFWIKFGMYQISPFTDNLYYGAFPSGHTTYIAAPMFVLWWRLPRYRLLYAGIILLVMIGLVGAGHHFPADVIAGLFLGLAAAAGTLAMWPKAAA